jgi:hypothetical protein
MNRLITFGCSHTYGQCLPDRSLSWPSRLAKLLNLECVNLGEEGASNKKIWHNIINFNFMPEDTIVIQWTYPERWCVLDETQSKKIGPWINDAVSTAYYEHLFSHYDANLDINLRMSHINLYLKELKIYNVLSQIDLHNNLDFNNSYILDIDFDNIRENNEKGSDGVHAGATAHQLFAELIAKEIKNDTR